MFILSGMKYVITDLDEMFKSCSELEMQLKLPQKKKSSLDCIGKTTTKVAREVRKLRWQSNSELPWLQAIKN